MRRRNRRSGVGYFIFEGLRGVLVHKFMSFASVTIIAACLLVTVTFGLVAYNIGLKVEQLSLVSEIMLYIDETFTESQARALKARIEALDNVKEAVFVTKDEILENYLEKMGDEAKILADLKNDNPMRDSFRIVMVDISLHSETVAALEKVPGIASSSSEKEVSDALVQIRSVVDLVSYALIGLLGAVSVFIVFNTVRLALFHRREEIAIMKMVGATNHFIRVPFVIEGVTLGMLAGGLSFLCQWGFYGYLSDELKSGTAVLEMVPFSDFSTYLLWLLLAVGALIGVVGSAMSIRRFLKV